MVAGLSVSCVFLVLGIREIGQPAKVATARPAANAPALQPAMLALATTSRAIAVGETITAALIRTRAGNAMQYPTIATPAEVIGKVAVRPIAMGTPIDRTMIDTETKLAIRIPVGMRAMSIDTTAEIAVAGLVRPGDRVDVQVVYPGEDAISGTRGQGRSHAETLLQMVPVLAVGDLVIGTVEAGNATPGNTAVATAPAARTVTLALTPAQASTLSLAKNVGALYLSLRNPSDQIVTAAAVFTPHAAPARATAATPRRLRKASPREPGGAIELVIGGRSEILQSGGAAQ